MQLFFESRYACSPAEVEKMNTAQLRQNFLIEKLFGEDEVHLVLSYYDRYMVGGIMPLKETITMPCPEELKANYFLERREMGIINVGGAGKVTLDGIVFQLQHKEALYIGKGSRQVLFDSIEANKPAKFYINSAPAHQPFPTKKIGGEKTIKVEMGSMENANHRTINKLIVSEVLEVCQVQMGMTELKTGSVWNTMPPHTHDRRMAAYFYFDLQAGQSVCHFMGQPQETRHIWMQNEQAVISPNWSIHAGAGTSNYTFIWGMAGENLDYGDMDHCTIGSLK